MTELFALGRKRGIRSHRRRGRWVGLCRPGGVARITPLSAKLTFPLLGEPKIRTRKKASPIGVPAEAQPVRWVRWGKEEMRSDRAFRPWAETRDAQLATTLGYRLRLDESVPDVFALVPSPNSNQRRCSRASSHLQYRRKVPVNPVKTHERESVLFHWFSAASCLLRPEVVRSNTVGSPLGGVRGRIAGAGETPQSAL